MNVREFLKLEKSGAMVKVIDGDRVGCFNDSCQVQLLEADRSTVAERYGDFEVYAFEPYGKRAYKLYVRKAEGDE